MAIRQSAVSRAGVDIDAGLRAYMTQVYNLMALGVAFTGLAAYFTIGQPEFLRAVALGPLKWILFIGVLGLGFFAPRLILGGSSSTAYAAFWSYAAMWGLLAAPMIAYYTGESVARAFFAASAAFLGASFYGYATKKDLSAWGRFITMAIFGIFAVMIMNFFIKSAQLQTFLSIGVVLLFSGLTAYETQMIKESYFSGDSSADRKAKAIFGAFALYGSFITLFIHILSLIGVARSE